MIGRIEHEDNIIKLYINIIKYFNILIELYQYITYTISEYLINGGMDVNSWQELTRMTGGEEIVVEKVRLVKSGIAIEGEFELPPMARLSMEDQVFVAAFIRSDGSIKQTERMFGVSYPTIKSRLKRIAAQLEFVQIESGDSKSDILARLENGEITVDEALELLK